MLELVQLKFTKNFNVVLMNNGRLNLWEDIFINVF